MIPRKFIFLDSFPMNANGKADRKKYPTYASGQRCGTCILFEGRPTDMAGPCPLFPGKRVSAAGWCSSWAKKQ